MDNLINLEVNIIVTMEVIKFIVHLLDVLVWKIDLIFVVLISLNSELFLTNV